uniref:Uncharacterized protein n=1 Tax=uncultured Acetothermia bacterium TaxID=236499 RepID=H5SJJ8_9BACT|nr:hypothetical protein HGMM_F36B04C37 [uncultured Acetothermia bacterium]
MRLRKLFQTLLRAGLGLREFFNALFRARLSLGQLVDSSRQLLYRGIGTGLRLRKLFQTLLRAGLGLREFFNALFRARLSLGQFLKTLLRVRLSLRKLRDCLCEPIKVFAGDPNLFETVIH